MSAVLRDVGAATARPRQPWPYCQAWLRDGFAATAMLEGLRHQRVSMRIRGIRCEVSVPESKAVVAVRRALVNLRDGPQGFFKAGT